jgi:hypothetical protein
MENVRFQFELPGDRALEIERLMTECGIETKKDLFNNALTLLRWAVKETRKGHAIASVDEGSGKFRELQMPILAAVAPHESELAAE